MGPKPSIPLQELTDCIVTLQQKLEGMKDMIGDDRMVREQYEETMDKFTTTRFAVNRLVAFCSIGYKSADESPV
jgi:hypothetical protein